MVRQRQGRTGDEASRDSKRPTERGRLGADTRAYRQGDGLTRAR